MKPIDKIGNCQYCTSYLVGQNYPQLESRCTLNSQLVGVVTCSSIDEQVCPVARSETTAQR